MPPLFPFQSRAAYQASMPMLELALPTDAPFSIEPVEAWRAWEVDLRHSGRGPVLRSITYRLPWPKREAMRARCKTQVDAILYNREPRVIKHGTPHPGHRCGIYALKEEENVPKWATSTRHVGGRVRLWGRIMLYEKGYIAEFAYPIELTYRVDEKAVDDEIGHLLAHDYGIEVKW